MVVALVLVLLVRPDPKRIAELLHTHATTRASAPAAPLREIVRRRGVPRAGRRPGELRRDGGGDDADGSVVVDHHHHAGPAVFPIIGAHVLGMYALVLVIGR